MMTAKEARLRVINMETFIETMKQTVAKAIKAACDEARLNVLVTLPNGRHVIRVVEWLREEPRSYEVTRSYCMSEQVLHISWK